MLENNQKLGEADLFALTMLSNNAMKMNKKAIACGNSDCIQ